MRKYIYLITSPSGKRYVGKSTIEPDEKIAGYKNLEKYGTNSRKISRAIKKYRWDNMRFEIIEENVLWDTKTINERETYWISFYDSKNNGYNMTFGGDGVDSESAKEFSKNHYSKMSEHKKKERSINCSLGQKKRYENKSDSEITKKRKSDSHKGKYRIESPCGKIWETDQGLKEFAEENKSELKISYWQLFGAYRRCYNNTIISKKRKDNNLWKVTRIDS